MGNLDIEFQVRLGLAGALQQVKLLHEALENSVKIDSNGFKTIFDILKKAEASADKLSGRLNTAFKTSAGSKSFLKDYEKMIELLSTAQLKLGNLGFQDIKFSIQDLKAVDESVKRMQELEKAIDNILNLKAITLVNSSSVDGIEKLREYIASLNTDVSKLSFEKLSTSLSDALNEVNTKTTLINEQIANIDKTINGLDASSLKKLEAGINATNGVNIKLLDDKSIDAANEKLREFKKEFSGLSDKAYNSLLVTQSTKDISKFIADETDTIKSEYQKLIEAIRDKKAQIMAVMSSVDATGHFGKTGTLKYYNTKELNDILNSSEMVKEIFDKFDEKTKHIPSAAFAGIKVGLKTQIEELNKQEIDLTGLRDKVETSLSKVFDGLSERTVSDVKKVKTTIEDNLNQFNIKAADLKAFGFDISSIEKGQSLVTIYNNIAAAIDLYKAKLEETRGSLLNTDLVQLLTQFEQLSAAQLAWLQSQANSGDIIEKLKAEIADLREKLELLALSYNKEMTPKVNNNNLYQAKNALEEYINSLTKLEGKLKALSNVLMAVTRWMGFYQVLNLTKRAISDMKRHITELDTVMTKIAVVTNMSQNDLWGQIGKYSEIARQYGVAIKGVYEVSQIYYQQGLNKGDVMGLTTETLKMARIAGIDYATAADYMTTAIRGFKLEMTEAAHVTDVFSNLAAHTASSTEELATAISKTAASAANVGASFESTSAMMATMIATTRESATNIGTALKSIISRYGEMKVNPTGTDLEGEEYSLNKVDAALKSIGVSLLDANHQFRDFDDVIFELAEKWDSIDKSAQRYIATVMAGNRQQSRFLALVSNFEEYKRALDLANNSENAGELQTLKTLDSIDAKVERMKVTIQEFYTSSGILDLYKGILDTITNVISAANNLPKAFGKLPVTAIAIGFSIVSAVKNFLTLMITLVQSKLKLVSTSFDDIFADIARRATNQGKTIGKNLVVAVLDEVNKTTITLNTSDTPTASSTGGLLGKLRSSKVRTGLYLGSTAASLAGTALTLGAMNKYGAAKTEDEVRAAAGLLWGGAAALTASGALSGVATGVMLGGQSGGIWGAAIGGIIGAISSGWSAIASAIQMSTIDTAKKLELAQKEATEKQLKATEAKGKVSELLQAYNKLSDLEAKLYESVEAMQEYHEYMNLLADTYPYLVDSMTTTGDKIILTTELELELAKARGLAATLTAAALRAEARSLKILKDSYGSFLNLLGLTYTGDKNKFNVALLVSAVRGRTLSQAVEKGTNDKYLNDIEDPFEFLVKSYSLLKDADDSFGLLQNGKYKKNIVWKDEFYKHFDEIVNYYSQTEQLISKDYKTSIRQNLVNSLNELKRVNKDEIDFSEILQIEDFTDVNSLLDENKFSYEQIVEAVSRALKWAQEHINSLGESIDSINKTAFDTEIESLVLESAKKEGRKDLKNFTSIFGSLRNYLGYNFATGKDESETKLIKQYNESIRTDVEDWILRNTDAAKNLLLLQLNNFSTADADTFAKALGVENNNDNKIILDALVAKYKAETDKARTGFITALLKNVFKTGTDEDGTILFDEDLVNKWIDLTDNKNLTDIPPALLNTLLQQLIQYKELKDKGYTVAAENYLSGLENIYTLVGKLGEDKIDDVSAILHDLDLTDIESIDTAIRAFEGIDGAKEIVTELLNLRNKVALDIGITLERILSSASEAVSSVEKILDNIGKGMSESDALKQALEIINKSGNRTRQARSLVKFDSEVGQWLLTPLAIREAYNLTVDASKKEIEDITAILGAFNSDLGSTIASLSDFGDKDLNEDTLKLMLSDLQDKAQKLGLTPDLANKFIQDVLDWRNDYLKGNYSISWQEYIELQLKSYKELLEGQLITLLQLIKESPLEYLAKVNWENLASGEATDIEKEYLRIILQIAGMTTEQISTIMTEVAKGQYDNLEQTLSDLGLDFKVGKTTKTKARKANALSYITLFNELSDASINELSETAIAAAKELGYYDVDSFSSDLSSLPATVANLLKKTQETIDRFYKTNEITLKEYNDYYASAMTAEDQKNIDILDALLDAAGMTYDAFGELLTKYLMDFKTFMSLGDTGVERTKFGKIRILDFLKFINALNIDGFDINDPEFMKAYSDWTDARIEWENVEKQRIQNAVEEIKALGTAKVGDKLNVSYLETELGDSLLQVATRYGAQLNNGILTLTEQTDIPGMMSALADEAEKAGKLIPDLIAELADAVLNVLSNIISFILGGILGNLSNVNAAQLSQWATLNGVGQLDFYSTAEGLQLTEESFFDLYVNVAKTNKALAKKLLPDMANLSNKYKNINDVLDEFNKSLEDTAKRQTLQDLLTNLFTEPENYKMLNYNLPSTWEMASNFYGSDKEAIDITKAIQTGSVGVEDFSKIVLAMINGGDAEVRKKGLDLLRQAPDYWKIDSKGNFVVDTKAWGLDKLYKEILDAYYKSTENFLKEAAKKLEEFNTLFFGSEYLLSADIWESNGDLNNDALRKLLTSNTDEGKIISQLLSLIQVENEDLAQLIKEGNDYSAYVPLIKQLAETNWEVGKTEELWLSVLANAGVGGTITFDENGKSTITIDESKSTIEFIYKYNGLDYTAEGYAAVMAALAHEQFKKLETNDAGVQDAYTYKLAGHDFTLIRQDDGTVIHEATFNGQKIRGTEEDILAYMAAFDDEQAEEQLLGVQKQERTLTVDGIEYKIIVKNGISTVISKNGKADIATKLLDELNKVTKNGSLGATTSINADATEADKVIDAVEKRLRALTDKNPYTVKIQGEVTGIPDTITKPAGITKVFTSGGGNSKSNLFHTVRAQGNVALAAGRKTLMGELGPEMYVTNGHYYIAGQNGAEMVDLPDDAIVFNHLLTRRLLDKGYGGRGKPVTNERKAAGEAHPNGRAPKDIVADFEKRIKDLNDDIAKIDQSIQDANQMYDKKVRNDVIKSLKTTRAEKVKDLNSLKNDRDYKKAKRTEEQEAIKEQKRIERNKQFEEDKKILREKYGEGTEEFNEAFKILEANHKKDIEAINKSSSNLSTAAKSENNAAKALEQAAQALQDAALALTEAAENLSNGITSTKNAWSSLLNPLGGLTSPNNLVHPNAAPKLKDLFGATTTNSSQSAGGKAGNTSKYIEGYGPGTGGTLTRNRSNMLNEYVKKASGGKSGADKELKEVKSAVSTFLNDLLTLGIESIDLSKYEKLPAALKSEIQAKLDNNESYRSFVLAYASAMDKSMSEINETYFLAWQKDLEEVGMAEEQMTALEGLLFFKNGEISGTASDWTTLVGDKGFVGDAEEAGVLQWNALLRTYVATSMEAVLLYLNTTLGHIFNFPEALIDSEAEINSLINELISKSISEGISAKEFKNLEEMLRKLGYDNKIDYILTTQGKLMITKSSLESIGQVIGSSASTVIDSANSQLNDLVTLITQGFGSDLVINAELVNNVKDILSSLNISVNDLFTQTENGFVTSFDLILTLYSKLVLTNPEYATKLLLNMSDEWLTSAELKWKATELLALGKNKEAATVLDASIERANSIADLVSKSFTDFISNSEYNDLITKVQASGLDLSDINFIPTIEGYKLAFKDVVKIYMAQMDKIPEKVASAISSIDVTTLTNEEIAQYKDLIKAVEELSTLRIKETNELYFKALEAERGETAKSAMKGLQYYASGSLGGSSSDWVNLLGDNVKISLLVELGILAYNEALDTYVATDIASLQKLGLNGDIFDLNIIKDSIRSLFNEILDTFGKAIKDGLSNVDVAKFKELLSLQGINVDLTFEQALNGLKLTQESAISLYYLIKLIDSILGELVFKELRASLEESNDKYKTMTSLIVNIVDLQEKIDQADKYNDAKVKQYKEELALAKEIAAVRATSEDSSFNFLDQDIPGAMNNPLNYVKNWSNAWNELREAATDDKSIDFQHFYNILGEINNLAKASGLTLDFMGTTLDGSLEAWDKAVNKSIDALGTDADKNYGVLLSKFGDNLSGGADAFASSADGAIHTMAKSQIKILDALILMFEAIVAMEDFEGADLNLNDILDFEEVFQDTELEELAEKLTDPIIKAATTLQEKFSTNGELRQAFEAVKVNGYSMAEIVEDAAGGVRKLNLNAQDYAAALSVLYEMSKRGDFDINNIAESLREQLTLNHSNFEGNIEYGDFIFNMHYNVLIKKNESGQYVTPSGKTFDNADEAIHVAALEELAVVGAGKVENITVLADHTAQGTLTIANTEITVDALASGIYYTVNGQQYNNLEAAEYAIWDSSNSGLEFGEWKLQLGLTVRMSIHEVKVENLTKDLIANAVGTTWKEVQAEWNAGVDQNGENLSFEAKYGISLDDNTTEADWERFKELAGVETKAVEVTANVQVTEGSLGLMLMLEKGSATLNIEAAIDETSKLFTDGDFTSNLVVNLENAQKALAEFNSIVNGTTATEKVNSDTTEGENAAKTLRDLINAMQATITVAINDKASDIIDDILEKLDKLKDLTITIEATENVATASDGGSQAKGNVAMASGTRTLMGELGPELYVSGGRYHVAGENGAEFVNLPKDAIVFNHLQTQRLLSTGSTGRGRAVTSEANAVALAKGGPAAANAQKTLATLKQLRAMWSKLAEASIIDLAGAVNKESSGDKNKVGSWVADVEHWYNLLQKIARLEKEINYLEALRSKIEADRVPNGIEYYLSLVDSLKNLRELAATLKLLADSYDEYFEIRRKELNESPLSKFYEFNEAGQVQYKEGGLYQLASLFELDDTGKARYTPKQQYDILKSMGLGDYMLRDSNGLAIERDEENIDLFYYDSVQAAYERMTAELQEMQDLYNNKEDAKVAYLEAITKADQLLLNIIDNQMDMELKVLDAIETREQKIIDKMTKERQALADSSAKYFEGLELALSKEREMYSRLQDQDSLAKLQRRLSILQRSGGSASEIASLQQEITDKQRDAYFEAQETAIQEAKDASDLQLEKMQELIDLMTETLEYEKANGLLWGEVATILSGTSESIMEFITTNMPEWLEKSATALNEELRTLRNSTLQWVAYYNNGEELVQEMMGGVQESVDGLALTEAKKWNEEILKSSPLQLNYPVLDTQVAKMQALYENSNNNTQIDKLEYIFNVKELADAKETERLVWKAMMEGEEPWKNAFKRSPVNNSMSKGRYS